MRLFPDFRSLPAGLARFVEKRPLLCLLIVVLYVVSPFDVLPEAVMGPIGIFDDALVGIAALSLLKRAAKARISRRRGQAGAAPAPSPQPPERQTEQRRPFDRPNERRERDRGHERRYPDRRRDDRRR